MALGPRLDLRQTQTLVMTPQLRQAIKLLQYSNIEVASFVEEELERNPLLERDDSTELPTTERAAPDQVPERFSESTDAAQLAQADTLPTEMTAPLDADLGEAYDAGGIADGAPSVAAIDRPWRCQATSTSMNAASMMSPMSVARCATISASNFGCHSTTRRIA